MTNKLIVIDIRDDEHPPSYLVDGLLLEDVKSWIDDHPEIGPQLTVKLRAVFEEPLVRKGETLPHHSLTQYLDGEKGFRYPVAERLVRSFHEFSEEPESEVLDEIPYHRRVAEQFIYEQDLPSLEKARESYRSFTDEDPQEKIVDRFLDFAAPPIHQSHVQRHKDVVDITYEGYPVDAVNFEEDEYYIPEVTLAVETTGPIKVHEEVRHVNEPAGKIGLVGGPDVPKELKPILRKHINAIRSAIKEEFESVVFTLDYRLDLT